VKIFLVIVMITISFPAARAIPLKVAVATTPPPQTTGFNMGESLRPDGGALMLHSDSLRLDGKPRMPAMGELHNVRYPEMEWREELLKMKAGGIDTVATCVF